jgi:hypothetical protein
MQVHLYGLGKNSTLNPTCRYIASLMEHAALRKKEESILEERRLVYFFRAWL